MICIQFLALLFKFCALLPAFSLTLVRAMNSNFYKLMKLKVKPAT
uniref:Uncharacterized protein n=1 Tax=Rheinheimera sp. BAL341 TaxID=1708203 RepID=A0A486XIA2_9GAMM